MLRGRPLPPELRYRNERGEIKIDKPPSVSKLPQRGGAGYRRQAALPSTSKSDDTELPFASTPPHMPGTPLSTIRIFPYGVARNRLRQAVKRLRVPAIIVDQLGDADVLVTLRSYYRKRQKLISDAENRRMPTYVLRANTVTQMESFLSDLFNLEASSVDDPNMAVAIEETRRSIQAVLNGAKSIDLSPASAYIRRLQHQMARQANLVSHSYGKEPQRRVRIFRQ